jgi:drug/metabolite transporter (DMT)-like permease
MVTGASLAAITDAIAKVVVVTYPVVEVLFIRSIVALVLIAAIALARGGAKELMPTRPFAQVMRAIALGLAVYFFFTSLKYLPLAEVTALFFGAPLLTTLLSIPLLGEKVGVHRLVAVSVGLVGVFLVARPGSDLASWTALLPVAAATAFALAMIATRKLTQTETNVSQIAMATLVVIVGTVPFMPFVWIMPTAIDLMIMAGLGVMSVALHLAFVEAFRLAPVAVVAPFDYIALVWAVLFGYLFWGEFPDLIVWAGIAIIVGSGLYVLYREIRVSASPDRAVTHP